MGRKLLSPHHDLSIRFLLNSLITGTAALVIFLAAIPSMRWLFVLAVAAIGGIALWEYQQMLKRKGIDFLSIGNIVAVVLYIALVYLQTKSYPFTLGKYAPLIWLGLFFVGTFIYFALLKRTPSTTPGLVSMALSSLGVFYIGVPLGLIVAIMFFFTSAVGRSHPFLGIWWIIYLIGVTKSTDVGGYFIGRAFGRHPLAAKTSPHKTVEGACGGLLAAMLCSLLLCWVGRQIGGIFGHLSYLQALLLGLVIGIVGQIGDLCESFVKREAGVKDSNVIPGIGGVLDMIDSLLFTTPIVYVFILIFYR